MTTLAIVPARAGSKRLPGKNLRLLHGKPLICWTLEAALQAQGIDRVIVSTDSAEIAEVSRAERMYRSCARPTWRKTQPPLRM